MINKLLYLTYIPLNGLPTTGSSVRPQKMKEALENLKIEIKTFGGINNDISLRRQTVNNIKNLLKEWTPDACYIEPPSGPFFYYGDVQLIKLLHKKRIPSAIFYRDAYWRFPEYAVEKKETFVQRIKRFIIKCMQMWQWKIINNNIDIIYFPSKTMSEEFNCSKKDILPPGAFIPQCNDKKDLSNVLQYIFVGGAAKNHGTFITIDSFKKYNEDGIKAKLIYVCPKEQWDDIGIDKNLYKDWLEVIHTSGDGNLKKLYEKADISILTAPRTFYRDFAMPVKIFEYISYLKPILATNCTETARVISENNIGWVVEDNVDSILKQLEYLEKNKQEIINIKNNMKRVRDENLWECRANKIIKDLELIHY